MLGGNFTRPHIVEPLFNFHICAQESIKKIDPKQPEVKEEQKRKEEPKPEIPKQEDKKEKVIERTGSVKKIESRQEKAEAKKQEKLEKQEKMEAKKLEKIEAKKTEAVKKNEILKKQESVDNIKVRFEAEIIKIYIICDLPKNNTTHVKRQMKH